MSKADDELFGLKSSRTGEYLHSKSADELFEELGYTEKEIYKNGIEYFDDEDESIELVEYQDYGKRVLHSRFEGISMQELQAINEKVKELRLDRRRR